MQAQRGFTLIELMIVVAVLGIIAAIALPSYNEFVREGRRAEAVSGVSDLQLRQERWRAEHTSYGTQAEMGTLPESNHYTFSVTGGATYTVTATPKAADPKCGNLVASNTSKPKWAGDASCNK